MRRRCLQLIGLQPDQIHARLDAQANELPAWKALTARYPSAHTIDGLFQSPLYLAIALQVYRSRDPTELFNLSMEESRQRLWELLLETNADSYKDADSRQTRAWLIWLAAGLQRTNRQRFMLHELYQLDPDRDANQRAFRALIRSSSALIGVAFGLVYWLPSGLLTGLLAGSLYGLIFGLGTVVYLDADPSARVERRRLKYAMSAPALMEDAVFAVIAGLIAGLVTTLIVGPTTGLIVGLAFAVGTVPIGLTVDLLERETVVQSPRRYGHTGPEMILRSTLTSGLVVGLSSSMLVGLVFGLIVGPPGLLFGLVMGLLIALDAGLYAWLYHHWLRRRLRHKGVLPARLTAFLAWSADDARGWLRISDAYEFRHRELLEHLAPWAE